MEPLSTEAGQLVIASDVRNSLFRRALVLLDEYHTGLEGFNVGVFQPAEDSSVIEDVRSLAVVHGDQRHGSEQNPRGIIVCNTEGDPLGRLLATFLQGRTNTARRAVDAVAHIHSEIDSMLSSFEREFPPVPSGIGGGNREQDLKFESAPGQPSEEVLRMAAATTAAAARFRVRAAEAAKSALQVYDSAAKQAAAAAQATTQALELQALAEQHSALGNLPQALEVIRQATRLRDESANAALSSQKLQEEYGRHRREAQEAHAQAEAAMRHAYSLEKDAIRNSAEAAARQHAEWRDKYQLLSRQMEDLRAQAAAREAEADASAARAEQAQKQADMQMAAGNYDLGNALVSEAVRSNEQAGYARAQAAAAREALQRLAPDVQKAREHVEEAEEQIQELSRRQAHLQDATSKQRMDRLQEEAEELAALCVAAEAAASMHAELARVYEDRLEQDRRQYDALTSEGKCTEADALAVHINTWQELLDVARQNRDTSRAEAVNMRARLDVLRKIDVNEEPISGDEGPPEEFQQLRSIPDKGARAAQATAILVRGLMSAPMPDPALEIPGAANDGLLLQTELHHQRVARLTQQMQEELQRLEDGSRGNVDEGSLYNTQAEALLDSMAVSHLVGTLETTRLLQLWKQCSEQAMASALDMRKMWISLEREVDMKADEATRLEQEAQALEREGRANEAASALAQSEALHRMAEQLKLEADKAKAAFEWREKAAGDAQTQSRFLVQGLHSVEQAAGRLQSGLGFRGYNLAAPSNPSTAQQELSVSQPFSPPSGQTTALVTPKQDEPTTVAMTPRSMVFISSSALAPNRAPSSTTSDLGRPPTGTHVGLRQALLRNMGRSHSARERASANDSVTSGVASMASGPIATPWTNSMPSGISELDSYRSGALQSDTDKHARLTQLIHELESHSIVGAPHVQVPGRNSQAMLSMLLELPHVDEATLAAITSSSLALKDEVRELANIAEMQLQRDAERQMRWRGVVEGLPPSVEAPVPDVVDQTSQRCLVVASASSLAEDALTIQANCAEALASTVASYRSALSSHRSAAQVASTVQTEVSVLQQQTHDSMELDTDLVQHIDRVGQELAAFEARGSTAQALTTRYELQRLQNKHADEAARTQQLQVTLALVHQKAEEALNKEAEVSASVQSLGLAMMSLASAATEAGEGVKHALESYRHAVSALALGAQVDLARLRSGDAAQAQETDSEVERHLIEHQERASCAHMRLSASRRLQESSSSQILQTAASLQVGDDVLSGVSGAHSAPLDNQQRLLSQQHGHDSTGVLSGQYMHPGQFKRESWREVPSQLERDGVSGPALLAPDNEAGLHLHGNTSGQLGGSGLNQQGLPSLMGKGSALGPYSADLGQARLPGQGGQEAKSIASYASGQMLLAGSRGLGDTSSLDTGRRGQDSSSVVLGQDSLTVAGNRLYNAVELHGEGQMSGLLGRRVNTSQGSSSDALGQGSSSTGMGLQGVVSGLLGRGSVPEQRSHDASSVGSERKRALDLGGTDSQEGRDGPHGAAVHEGVYGLSRGHATTLQLESSSSRTGYGMVQGLRGVNSVPADRGCEGAHDRWGQEGAPGQGQQAAQWTGSAGGDIGHASMTAGAQHPYRLDSAPLHAEHSSLFVNASSSVTSAQPYVFGQLATQGLAGGDLGSSGVQAFGEFADLRSQPSFGADSNNKFTPGELSHAPISSVLFSTSSGLLQSAPSSKQSTIGMSSGSSSTAKGDGTSTRTGRGLVSVSSLLSGGQGGSQVASGEPKTAPSLLPPLPPSSALPSAHLSKSSGSNGPSQPLQAPNNARSQDLGPGPSSRATDSMGRPYADASGQLGFGQETGSNRLSGESPSSPSRPVSMTPWPSSHTGAATGNPSGPLPPMHSSVIANKDSVSTAPGGLPGSKTSLGLFPSQATDPIEAVLVLEAELADLNVRYHGQLKQMWSPPDVSKAVDDPFDQFAVTQNLSAQLREAQQQLQGLRAQQGSLRDVSPLEVHAYHDKLQYHEDRVVMLQEALRACGEIASSKSAVERTRGAIGVADQEAQHCEEALSLLSKAAEMCSSAARELQLQSLDVRDQADAGLHERLSFIQGKAAEISKQKEELQQEADNTHRKSQQLIEQLAAEESAVQICEDWLQQARKAAATASVAKDWDARLATARSELQELEAPVNALQDKAKAASNLAQTMTNAAAQHRQQAAEMIRQAASQREEARRLAVSGQQLESDAAKAMADSMQQQADGLLAQAARMEDDAQKLQTEANQLQLAAEGARASATAKAAAVEQVTTAHRLSLSMVQWNRTAATKLHDASQKQAAAVRQQLALAEAEQELASMEAQMSASGSLRPDELAAHMINVVRVKQKVSLVRASLRTAHQQLDLDRDAAAAAVRQASKAEGQCAQLEPKILELEQQASMAPSALRQALDGATSVLRTEGSANAAQHHGLAVQLSGQLVKAATQSQVSELAVKAVQAQQAAFTAPLVSGDGSSLSAGFSQTSGTLLSSSALSHATGSDECQAPAVAEKPPATPRISIVPITTTSSRALSVTGHGREGQLPSNASTQPTGPEPVDNNPLSDNEASAAQREASGVLTDARQNTLVTRPAKSAFAESASATSGGAPFGQWSARNSHQPPQNNIVKLPLSRLRIDTSQLATSAGDTASPLGFVSIRSGGGGLSVQQTPQGSPWPHMSRTPSLVSLSRHGLQEPQGRSRSCSPLAVGHSRITVAAERQSQLSQVFMPDSPKSPRRGDKQAPVGTAADLLDKVAGKSLRPLSHIKILVGPDSRTAKPQEADTCWPVGEQRRDGRTLDETANGGQTPSGIGGMNISAYNGCVAEEIEEPLEDGCTEPDTKMYRSIKQRIATLEVKIPALRRQRDTAETAADMLARKREDLQADIDAEQDVDEAQQTVLLEHGDALLRLKEAEASFFQRQAELLEEELTACRDALQYAVVDWNLRRELKRQGTRCDIVTGKAQSKAMEAHTFDAEVADATECIMLATARTGRHTRAYTANLEQHSLGTFLEEQQLRVKTAHQRAAESRAEAAQLAVAARSALAKRLLFEKKALCNKALYQSAVDLADAYQQSVSLAALSQHYGLLGLKSAADAISQRVQEAEGGKEGMQGHLAALAPARGRGPMRSGPQQADVLNAIAQMGSNVSETIQQYLQEIVGNSSEVLLVQRRRMTQISSLMQLYQTSYENGDHTEDSVGAPSIGDDTTKPQQQPSSDAEKRAARITAAQNAVRDLDRACALASELRSMCVEAAAAHGALFDVRADPDAIRMQLMGQKTAIMAADQEEAEKHLGRLALLDVEVPLARDQLTAALQMVDYRHAAAQLFEAQQDLQYASVVAGDAVSCLESTMAVHRENLSMMNTHLQSILEEVRMFSANGNVMQASAAEEAARCLAKDALAAEESLAALLNETQLKRDEQSLAGAASEELSAVAHGSTELVNILLRIVDLQSEARVVSRRVNDLTLEEARAKQESKSRQSLADTATKQADLLQHESIQCRTNLKFAEADAHMAEARRCRASAQEHTVAVATALQDAAAASQQLKTLEQRQQLVFREVQLLHSTAGHLQDALSCMRDKHHLVRKLRDAEYQRRQDPTRVEVIGAAPTGPGQVAETDVLQTQVTASNTTIQHHLASKTSYLSAADQLQVAVDSLRRMDMCTSQADAAMQDLMKVRMAAATAARAATSLPLLTNGSGSDAGGLDQSYRHRTTLFRQNRFEDTTASAALDTLGSQGDSAMDEQQQQAELRYRCLRGAVPVLDAITVAAERASEARQHQVSLSDQAAKLVSDLAAKILEAEANADEAAGLEASMRSSVTAIDEDDEENLKNKLMVNALLQKAEAYRGEAATLQSRIRELEEQEHEADARATELTEALQQLQGSHRHTLEALELTERISACRAQEATLRSQAKALSSEVGQLDRETTGLQDKTAQLRQQLTSASHAACSEDVANLMLVVQQMTSKTTKHRQLQQQRREELEGNTSECRRLAGDVTLMLQRAEHLLHARETQNQVRQAGEKIAQLQSELAAAQEACDGCGQMLDELRQQHEEEKRAEEGTRPENASSPARCSQQQATTQATITMTEQMFEAHSQRVAVLQAAVVAWEAVKQRHEAVLRHQEQLMQQAEWRVRLQHHQDALRAAAAEHSERARQLRNEADKASSDMTLVLAGHHGIVERSGQGKSVCNALTTVRSQAATIKAATEAAQRHALAEAEDELAMRANALAAAVEQQAYRLMAAADLVHPMYERLSLTANTSMSVARVQLSCVEVCSGQGAELSAMHDAVAAVRELTEKIQSLLETADHHMRAGQSIEAATARGKANALQDALQTYLKAVRSCRQQISELDSRMQDAKEDLRLAENRMAHVSRPAAVAQSVIEYVHQACKLYYECAERQRGTLQLSHLAAEAKGRSENVQRELKASQAAAQQLITAGKMDSATIVERAARTLEHSLTEAEAQWRVLDAQVSQESEACATETAAAGLYADLAILSVNLLRHMDELEEHQEGHQHMTQDLELLTRSLETSRSVLQQRRKELDVLSGQVEEHRLEAQLLLKMGNSAQARVRDTGADAMIPQLAEVADDVMKMERRSLSLSQRHAVLTSLHAKSEARIGLLSQLARLCSSAVGHLLDARDAHSTHVVCTREAAITAVDLGKEEAALTAANAKVRELQASLAGLRRRHEVASAGVGLLVADDDLQDSDRLLHATNLAQAELLLVQRKRGKLEQQVLDLRSRSAQANLAMQSSKVRTTRARQRAEDAQRLIGSIQALLDGSGAASHISETLKAGHSATLDHKSETPQSARENSPADDASNADNPRSGILAAAQLHSVTLQALAESVSKFMQTLDLTAKADDFRAQALVSAQKAQAAREAAQRQEAVVEETRTVAEKAALAQQVRRMHGWRASPGDERSAGRCMWDTESNVGSEASSSFTALGGMTAGGAQVSATAAAIELQRLQHEIAYQEAAATQESKLVTCLEQQQELLRRASDCLMDMAKFGIAAEQNASPDMSAEEAASLLAACNRLAEQHAATLQLVSPLKNYQQAETALRSTLECIEEARRMRGEMLRRRLSEVTGRPTADAAVGTGNMGGSCATAAGGRDPAQISTKARTSALSGSVTPQRQAGVAGRYRPTSPALQVEHDDLLAEEERLLKKVQELSDTATQLLEGSKAGMASFSAEWSRVSHSVEAVRQPQRLTDAYDFKQVYGERTGFMDDDDRDASIVHGARTITSPDGSTTYPQLAVSAHEQPSALQQQLQQTQSWQLQEALNSARSKDSVRTVDTETPSLRQSCVALTSSLPQNLGSADFAHATSNSVPQPLLPDPASSAEVQEGRQKSTGLETQQNGSSPDRKHRQAEVPPEVDLDAELLAMAAATVARAKAAAAALAARSRVPTTRSQSPTPCTDGKNNFSQVHSEPPSASGPICGGAQGISVVNSAEVTGPDAGAFESGSLTKAVSHKESSSRPPSARDVRTSGLLPRPGQTMSVPSTSTAVVASEPCHLPLSQSLNKLQPQIDASKPPADAQQHVPNKTLAQAHSAEVSAGAGGGTDGLGTRHLCTSAVRSQPASQANGTCGNPGGNTIRLCLSGPVSQPPARSSPAPKPTETHMEPNATYKTDTPPATSANRPASSSQLASAVAAWQSKTASPGGSQPDTPALARLPLPEDLDGGAAVLLLDLWSTAALNYHRAQEMHDGMLQHIERQWQRCQAQLQQLQSEEAKARATGRLGEADVIVKAAGKWQQRGGHLQAAKQRHCVERIRHRAMAHRAMAMSERLQLLTMASAGTHAAGTSASGVASTSGGLLMAGESLQNLVPRLPGTMLSRCGVLQSLERLNGELSQQVTALHAAVSGLHQQSQRLFAKASRRSNKLKIDVGSTDDPAVHAAAISRSQTFAEQSAELSERAVELAAQARTLQELADALCTESSHCSKVVDRLQRAVEQELSAQQALVQAVDLLLCGAMQTALLGKWNSEARAGAASGLEVARESSDGPAGDFDSLLRGGHPPGAYVMAARAHARRGEDLAQEAARTVQSAKEQLELRMMEFMRCMDEVGTALSKIAEQRTRQQVALQTQVDAATLCVARARAKISSHRAAGDAVAAEKYCRAAEGWSKQLDKLRREVVTVAASVDDLSSRAQVLAGLGPQLQPMQSFLDGYLDQHLEAWAAAALSRVRTRDPMT